MLAGETMENAMRLQDGQLFAGYRIERRLGRGGMASVYLAVEDGLTRRVALKVLPEDVAEDEAAVARFAQEAQTVAALEHPNIVPLYRYGVEQGVPWMALRLVEGGDLSARLKRPLPASQGVAMLKQIAAALDFAHARGVLHRDLKPQNVLIDGDGHVYLADFGIAKLMAGSSLVRTATGGVLGTPAYMSPEYAQGLTPGPGADIYALGVIAFEWLTGAVPFDADTPQAVLFKHVLEPLPQIALKELPEAVVRVMNQVLDKKPEMRHASAGGFVEALSQAMNQSAQTAIKPTSHLGPVEVAIPPPPPLPLANTPPEVRATPSVGARSTRAPLAIAGGLLASVIAAALIWWPKPGNQSTVDLPKTNASAEAGSGQAERASAPSSGQPAALDPSLEPEMMPIPTGGFTMGSPDSEAERGGDEGPQRRVAVRSFLLAKHEVTVGDFKRFVEASGYVTEAENDVDVPDRIHEVYAGPNPGCRVVKQDGSWAYEAGRNWRDLGLAGSSDPAIRDQLPVVCVSYNDVVFYISWLNTNTGKNYRLPSEAEQEYVLRSGQQGLLYPWGDDPNLACAYGNVAGSEGSPLGGAWAAPLACDDANRGLSPVGSYLKAQYGLFDITGNAWEWSQDCYDSSYQDAPTDGSAVDRVGCVMRVQRGGAFNNSPSSLRVAYRSAGAESARDSDVGFRLAMDVR
jgi:serine/threonine-protein kinase